MQNLPVRKNRRLKGYNYSQAGCYFLTFCVKDRRELLGKIVGRGILDAPSFEFSTYGKYVAEVFQFLNSKKNGLSIEKYVIMPNHVHFIALLYTPVGGASGKPRPTNALIPKLISAIKRYTNKRAGFNLWQNSYHDHIIRNEADYQKIWQYIDENPAKWREDCYYSCD